MWTVVTLPMLQNVALSVAKGSYQRAVILGRENLSGSTLKGKARSYGDRYAASRRNLIRRIESLGVPVSERTGIHNRRILVIGPTVLIPSNN